MRLKLLTLALTLAVLPLSGRSEDLLDAYREARANDPVLALADAQRLITSENVPQARALLLPNLAGSVALNQSPSSSTGLGGGNNNFLCSGISAGNGTYDCLPLQGKGNGAGGGHTRSRTIGATLGVPIVNLANWATLSATRYSARAGDQTYDAASQLLYVRVTSAYFTVLTSEDALTFSKANEDALKLTFDQADQRYKVGLSAITAVYQAKSQYELARAQTITAQNNLAAAREALTQITGKPSENLKKLREDLPMNPPSPDDPNQWVQDAIKNNPTILSQQFTVQAAERSISAARAGHLPTLNGTVTRSKTSSWSENGGSSSGTGNGSFGNTFGVTLSIPIFEGGATQSKVRQAIYQRDAAQDTLESNRRQVVYNVLNDYRIVVAGIAQVEAGKAAVDSGKKSVEATRAGFDVGTQTMIDVLNAIQVLTNAQSTYSQNRHQFVLSQLQLKQDAGSIGMKDLEAVNALLQ
ncbi:TolC family outer membrane protein [Dyella silvatica]|uniref:TolC family outer membrane protein n=1 Tax=Dyella silvatica TaxID=2992128 RepID=UPI0022526AEF|nr:TolC family outer membrane protein [Dyella silvatica]